MKPCVSASGCVTNRIGNGRAKGKEPYKSYPSWEKPPQYDRESHWRRFKAAMDALGKGG